MTTIIKYIEIYDPANNDMPPDVIAVHIDDGMDTTATEAAATKTAVQWASDNDRVYDRLRWKWINHNPINFSPFATNVMTWVDRDGLIMPDGKPVKVTRASNGWGFVVSVNDQPVSGQYDNVGASYVLNEKNVGIRQP